jgi:hypothetical protein
MSNKIPFSVIGEGLAKIALFLQLSHCLRTERKLFCTIFHLFKSIFHVVFHSNPLA